MKKMENREHIEGYVYQHTLELKVTGPQSKNPGTEFISGNLEVAVDEELLNVIPVHFTYVTATTASGANNVTYNQLKKIIDEDKSVVTVGKEQAFKVKIDTALGLNEFYNQQDELVSVKTNEGGFVTIVSALGEERTRNTFKVDMLITGTNRIEADEEKNIPEEYMTVRGAVFNFRNALLPVEFTLRDKKGMDFFEDLGASQSEPILKQVWGRINCSTTKVTSNEETAFGEAAVTTYERKVREWLLTGSSPAELEFAEEEGAALKPSELKKASEDRQVMLADEKKRVEEYRAQKAAGTTTTQTTTAQPSTVAKAGEFKF